jgi:integrase
VQQKTGKRVWIPLHKELVAALEAAPRRGETIVVTHWGKPFSIKALGMRMQEWTSEASIPPGYTLHGLRKTLGKLLAEGGASTRQIMDILGHSSIQHVELYTREAEQKRLASDGMATIDATTKTRLRLVS